MSKIIQLRRGSGAEHNNFTGMPGEVTMDMDAKTLRVHDGETLGGVMLARADQIPNGTGENFDITTVSDEFWAETIARFAPSAISKYESRDIDININTSAIEYVFGTITQIPFVVNTVCVCQSPDAGYAIGDVVSAFGIGAYANPRPNTWIDENGLHVRIYVANNAFWVCNKTTGIATNIVPENWKIKFYVYC